MSLWAAILLAGCATGPRLPLPPTPVDISRMYGGWYLIATLPNWFEKGMVAPYDVYSRRPDGDIREDFYVQRGSFHAPRQHFRVHDWVTPGARNARWRVQVLWPMNLPFNLLYVDPDYHFALYGEDNRSMGGIYARTRTIDDADYQALLARFQAAGYDAARFRKFIQTPDQIGQPGYWSDGVKSAGK